MPPFLLTEEKSMRRGFTYEPRGAWWALRGHAVGRALSIPLKTPGLLDDCAVAKAAVRAAYVTHGGIAGSGLHFTYTNPATSSVVERARVRPPPG